MPIREIADTRVFVLDSDAPVIAHENDALDAIGDAGYQQAALVVIPVDRLDPEFFRLASRLAGDVLQKFVNYRMRVAILGDISAHLEASSALRDFVWESNRGNQVWFVDDETALTAKLGG